MSDYRSGEAFDESTTGVQAGAGRPPVPKRLYSLSATDKTRHAALCDHPRATALGRGRQTRRLVGFDVDLAVEDTAAEFQELGPDPLAAPALQRGLANVPPCGQLSLVKMNDFHLGLLPNELAGVHEGAVWPGSQVIPRSTHAAGGSFNS